MEVVVGSTIQKRALMRQSKQMWVAQRNDLGKAESREAMNRGLVTGFDLYRILPLLGRAFLAALP
jgi:hypothetical protein